MCAPRYFALSSFDLAASVVCSVKVTQLTGYLKVVWLEIFSPVFPGFSAEADRGTPLDRRDPPGTSISIKNQPRRPIRRQFRGTQKIPPDCLQVPRLKEGRVLDDCPTSGRNSKIVVHIQGPVP